MSDHVKKLYVSEIKKYKSKTDSSFGISVAIILIIFLVTLTFVLIGQDTIFGTLRQTGVILLILIIILFVVVLWSLSIIDRNYQKKAIHKSNLKSSEKIHIFIDGSITFDSYIGTLHNRYNEIDPIMAQLEKVHTSLQIDTLLSPNDLDYYTEAKEEFSQYDEELVSFIEKQSILIRYTMSKHTVMDVFFGKKGDNADEVKKLIRAYNNLIDKRTIFQNQLNAFKTKLSKFIVQFSSWNDVIEVITQSRPGIQLSLDRIAELINYDKNEIEILLKKILEQNVTIGEYFDFERTFIRTVETSNEIEALKRTTMVKSSSPESLQKCSKCDEFQSLLIRQCRNCNAELVSCQICKRGFRASETKINCPHCENLFHPKHLGEVVKVTGKCPVCSEGISGDYF